MTSLNPEDAIKIIMSGGTMFQMKMKLLFNNHFKMKYFQTTCFMSILFVSFFSVNTIAQKITKKHDKEITINLDNGTLYGSLLVPKSRKKFQLSYCLDLDQRIGTAITI